MTKFKFPEKLCQITLSQREMAFLQSALNYFNANVYDPEVQILPDIVRLHTAQIFDKFRTAQLAIGCQYENGYFGREASNG